jgi:hypothetical protein
MGENKVKPKKLTQKQLFDKGITSPEAFADGEAGWLMPFGSRLTVNREGLEWFLIDRFKVDGKFSIAESLKRAGGGLRLYDLGDPDKLVKLMIPDEKGRPCGYYFSATFIAERMRELAG